MTAFRDVKITYVLLLLLACVFAELPSCYRARCSHCTVDFIAKMCPSTCSACGSPGDSPYGPKLRSGRPMYIGDANGSARVHGVSAISSQSTAQRELHLVAAAAETGNPPTAQQLPDSSYSDPYASQQPQQQFYTQQQQNTQQPYFNQQFPQSQQQQFPQTTSYGSSYGAPSAGQSQLYNSFAPQQSSYYQQQQQQPSLYSASRPSNTNFYDATNAAQPAQSAQPFNFFGQSPSGQPTPSPFINPFQPFLQQSIQAQQQAPYFQPFTPPPFTPSPMLAALATPSPPLRGGSASGSATGPIVSLPLSPPALPSYLPAAAPQPLLHQSAQVSYGSQQGPSQYSYIPRAHINEQSPQLLTNSPKQIYSQPATPLTPQIYNVPQVRQQVASSAASNSIDVLPDHINKNSYGDKSGGQLQNCPKQPNWEPCVSKDIANERFRNCCLRLGEGCSQLCSYDQTLATIQIAVLTGRCPLGKVADMMICASGYEDATACCQAYNVFEPGFEHCRPYCNPAAGLPNDGMLAEKYRCLGKLSQIQRCFYVSQKP